MPVSCVMKNKNIVFLLFLLIGICSAQAQQKVTPLRGEGLDAFLIRNHRTPKVYRAEFIQLNKSRLDKGNCLLEGVKYTIPGLRKAGSKQTGKSGGKAVAPAVGSTFNEPLFGKKLAKGKVTSNRMAGACIYLVSGHGGPDPGAIGRCNGHQLHEDEYAYDIMLRLARFLKEEGAEVRIIIQDSKDGIRDEAYLSNSKRETCMGSPIPLNQLQRLKQRCAKVNEQFAKDKKKYSYCRAMFIHVDSRSKRKQTDVFFYHSNGSSLSKRLATNMKNIFEEKYDRHQPDRGFRGTVSGRGLYVLRNSAPVSVFVELGNIQNSFDQRRFILNSNRSALAKWLKDGFVRDYKRRK